jgi:hypothetical protein
MSKSDKYEITYKVAVIITGIEVTVRAFSRNITELDFYMTLAFIVLSVFGCRLLLDYHNRESNK